MVNTFNVRALIEYDGTDFRGWQIQPDQRTVQGELEGALKKVFQNSITLYGSGRTDAGVHAVSQVASFRIPNGVPLEPLRRSMNALTGDDVRVRRLDSVLPAFHARHSARSRIYRYLLGTDDRAGSPFFAKYVWNIGTIPSYETMSAACDSFVGARDFRHFSKSDPVRDDYRSVVDHLTLTRWELGFVVEIRANRFLPQMARRMVGQMVEIGRGETGPESVERIFTRGPDRRVVVAPAHGLFLWRVDFDRRWSGDENDYTTGTWRYLHEVLH
jgi:tRNA pseudouridine38-40 synthase